MPNRKRRPRALTEGELLHLDGYLGGMLRAQDLKHFLANGNLTRHRKYNNYIRWRKRELNNAT
jgi:hypothetical protein